MRVSQNNSLLIHPFLPRSGYGWLPVCWRIPFPVISAYCPSHCDSSLISALEPLRSWLAPSSHCGSRALVRSSHCGSRALARSSHPTFSMAARVQWPDGHIKVGVVYQSHCSHYLYSLWCRRTVKSTVITSAPVLLSLVPGKRRKLLFHSSSSSMIDHQVQRSCRSTCQLRSPLWQDCPCIL